jgi:predicted N-formylglutamate amidohydrolase
MLATAFIVTCEHGGNRIPAPFQSLFRTHRDLLPTHRGYDPGALVVARELAEAFGAPLVTSTVSRLLVDLNRSIGHPQLFSKATRTASAATRTRILEEHYRPYRAEVEQSVRRALARGRHVVHVSSHSFTPILDGHVRTADVGLLYDPRRAGEARLCALWKKSLATIAPGLRIRRNYPYAGKGDGLTSYLRKAFPPRDYVGVELEINQAIVFAAGRPWTALRRELVASLRAATDPRAHP